MHVITHSHRYTNTNTTHTHTWVALAPLVNGKCGHYTRHTRPRPSDYDYDAFVSAYADPDQPSPAQPRPPILGAQWCLQLAIIAGPQEALAMAISALTTCPLGLRLTRPEAMATATVRATATAVARTAVGKCNHAPAIYCGFCYS